MIDRARVVIAAWALGMGISSAFAQGALDGPIPVKVGYILGELLGIQITLGECYEFDKPFAAEYLRAYTQYFEDIADTTGRIEALMLDAASKGGKDKRFVRTQILYPIVDRAKAEVKKIETSNPVEFGRFCRRLPQRVKDHAIGVTLMRQQFPDVMVEIDKWNPLPLLDDLAPPAPQQTPIPSPRATGPQGHWEEAPAHQLRKP